MSHSTDTIIPGLQLQNTYQTLPSSLHQSVLPTAVADAELLFWNKDVANLLQINVEQLSIKQLANVFCGNKIVQHCKPIAQAYAGHQFGYYNTLGDGRAILLGEQLCNDNILRDVQLKGAGPTPYSRRGDGRATTYAMLREYLISEAMHGLGVSTSRSLAVVTTAQPVYRQTVQSGAVLTRIMQSHIRVGTFEYVAQNETKEVLQQFTDYVIQRHYTHLANLPNQYFLLLEAIIDAQIKTVVQWMQVGFIHGVMNTDNTFVSGETADYGPCAFINHYKPDAVFSSIDTNGRYAFDKQGPILQFNLAVLANSLAPLFDAQQLEDAMQCIQQFTIKFNEAWLVMMCNKIGLQTIQPTDNHLVQILLDWMQAHEADYTNTFLHIQGVVVPDAAKYDSALFTNWVQLWQARLHAENTSIAAAQTSMAQYNPVYIPRNHLVEEALVQGAEYNNLQPFLDLLKILKEPFMYKNNAETFMQSGTIIQDAAYKTFCGT
jgi:serine/tyrosine/threonine adenylyltransferase